MLTIPAYALGNIEWDDEKLAAHVMLQRSDDAYNLEPSTAKTTVQKQSSNGALLSLRSLIESHHVGFNHFFCGCCCLVVNFLPDVHCG